MSNQESNSLEEQADWLLEGMARKKGLSMRSLGVIDRYRKSAIRRREIPLSSILARRNREDSGE